VLEELEEIVAEAVEEPEELADEELLPAVEEPEAPEELEELEAPAAIAETWAEDGHPQLVEDQEESIEELLEEVEFDLFLSSLDLSGLEGYRDEDGFLEIDDVNWVEHIEKQPLEIEYEPPLTDDEIAMLSDEDRERMEELQVVVQDDTDFAELEPLTATRSDRLPYLFRTGRFDIPRITMEELPVVADSDAAEVLPVEEIESGSIIEMVDGVFTINNSMMKQSVPEDPGIKALADSVLSRNGA
jgi:hypothetical protein